MKALFAVFMMAASVSAVGMAAPVNQGFVKKSETDAYVIYAKGLEKITVSKTKFADRPHAMDFCANLNLDLLSPSEVVKLAISDVTQQDAFLADAVVFQIIGKKRSISGIGGWTNAMGKNDIFMIRDDQEVPSIEQTELEPLNSGLKVRGAATLSFPALCKETSAQ